MLFLRSLAFNIFLYTFTALCSVVAMLLAIFRPSRLAAFASGWAQVWLNAHRVICGVSVEVRGAEHLPEGGCLIAMKHQSTWDTFALFALFDDPVYVLKNELTWIPIFGWVLKRLGCIPVKRGTGRLALDSMIRGAREACSRGQKVVIFPEGTRATPGRQSVYKSGLSHLYVALQVPCVPVALNSGLVWPRRQFRRPPGVVTVEILRAIPPGLPRRQMFDRVVNDIEAASRRLGDAGVASAVPDAQSAQPPDPPPARTFE
jgi:1-acyl-sn-glycerol-3-phosphate acyltransferase